MLAQIYLRMDRADLALKQVGLGSVFRAPQALFDDVVRVGGLCSYRSRPAQDARGAAGGYR